MRVPQVADRMKEAPAQAVRAVFSRVGQVLLLAERVRNRPASEQPRHRAGRASSTPPVQAVRWRSLDETGNVRLLTGEELAADDEPRMTAPAAADTRQADPQPEPEPADAEPASPHLVLHFADTGLADTDPADPDLAGSDLPGRPLVPDPAAVGWLADRAEPSAAADGASAEFPLPTYDQLSVPSIRARLRGLGPDQVRQLLDYEKAHAGRPELLTMFERRIDRLEAGLA